MYVVIGDKGSGAFSVEAALAEVGVVYEFRPIALAENEQLAPEFRKLNPSGKIPALLLPNGEVVTESLAILLTIADRFPTAKLLPPSGSDGRAQAYRWLAFMASELYPMVEMSDYPARFAVEGEPAEALRQRARERLRERISIVEAAVAGPWFLSSGFSLLDIYAAMFSRWRGSLGREWTEEGHIPQLDALSKTLASRASIRDVWKRHFPQD